MEKLKNIPSLRFPEFNGEWELKKLGDIGINIIDGDRGTNYPNGNDFSNEGYCLFMNAKNVTKNGFSFNEKSFITKLKDEQLRKGKLQRFDIVLTTRGSVGHISYYDMSVPFEHLRINSGMVLIRTNGETINSDYLYKFFNGNEIQKEISKISFGSAQPQLTVGEISKFKVCYPTIIEQTKIASFLTAVDEKLQALKQKKTLLEQYKKGVMQKIFSQELRFKPTPSEISGDNTSTTLSAGNGNEYPDWEEKKLGEVSRITTGSSNREDSNLDGEFTFFDRSQDIRSSNRFLFDAEAIIVPGEGQEFIPKYFIGKFDLHQRTYAIMDFEPNNGKFLFYSIGYNSNHLNSHAVGSTVKSLRLPMFETMPIKLPCLEEQTKIANFLSSIDDKINHCGVQIEKMEVWKKGLLQQMFC